MSQDITVTDLFCGAGGSSIGAEAAGARLVMAANHWRLAIDTHNTNFPDADHDCADVSQVNPRRYPRTDVLIASPECTNHSQAKSHKRPTTLWDPGDLSQERSRATMWDVPRFAEHHRYQLVVVENVVEARSWAPFEAWLQAMHALGYEHRAVYMNSMVAHPTPQSRDRMYIVFWRRGNPAPDLDFRPLAWCARCETDVCAVQSWKRPDRPWGRYRAQYTYNCPTCAQIALPYAWPAAAAIDWSLPAPRIGDRARPLADATLRRIRAGLERYGPGAIVQAAGHTYERPGYHRTWPLWQPLGTQTGTAQHALVVDTSYSGRSDSSKARPADDPLATQTGQQSQAIVVPLRTNGTALPAWDEPLRTMVAGNEGHALVVPLRRRGKAERADEAPVPTVVASGGHHALLVRNYTPRGDAAQMVRPVSHPMGSVTAVDHHSLLTTPFLTDYHGQGGARSVEEPIGTVDTRDRAGLVEPAVDVEDCGFRMLEPHEIGRAMAFADDYVVLGNKRDRVRQYGNAVTPPVLTWLMERCIATLRPGAV